MSGWSKRLPPIYEATAAAGMAHWTLHDLRRTMRTGLGNLGVDRVVAELLLNHAVSDELAQIYDRGEYWQARVKAAAAGRSCAWGWSTARATWWCRSGAAPKRVRRHGDQAQAAALANAGPR